MIDLSAPDRPLLPARAAPGPAAGASRLVRDTALVAVLCAVLGGLASPAQALPFLGSLANSASGFVLLGMLAVAATGQRRTGPAALLGAVGLSALMVGYEVVSALRGFPDWQDPFLGIALVAGPFTGVATAWLRRRGLRAALGVALLAGIALGDTAWGLLGIEATTGWVYWTVIGVVGAGLLAIVAVRRLDGPGQRVLAVVGTVLVAAGLFGTYSLL